MPHLTFSWLFFLGYVDGVGAFVFVRAAILMWVSIHTLTKRDHPVSNMFRVYIPRWCADLWTDREYMAVLLHELGHMHAGHCWRNYITLCCFRNVTQETIDRQEWEADRLSWAAGYGMDLESARRKLALAYSARHFGMYGTPGN